MRGGGDGVRPENVRYLILLLREWGGLGLGRADVEGGMLGAFLSLLGA